MDSAFHRTYKKVQVILQSKDIILLSLFTR